MLGKQLLSNGQSLATSASVRVQRLVLCVTRVVIEKEIMESLYDLLTLWTIT